MPEKELQKVTTTPGKAADDNFIVDSREIPKRSSGEGICCQSSKWRAFDRKDDCEPAFEEVSQTAFFGDG
jgi:hypothetical protein